MVVVVGELINTSRKVIREAVEKRDSDYIQQIAKAQEEAGANYLDINCGTMVGEEVAMMEWLVNAVQEVTNLPLCIDSPSSEALIAGLELSKSANPMINSITAEEKRLQSVLPLIKKYNAKIVALCIEDAGMPETAKDRLRIARDLVAKLEAEGISQQDIYLDPLIKPISAGDIYGREVLESIRLIKEAYPEVHFMCGLSNVSYSLPNRALINRLFMVQTMAMGMDGFILDPTNKDMMGALYIATALTGQDKYCRGYLKAHRKGLYA
ncbi:methyltetrahydrofolate cobalamin methyltransferase [Desulfosporosinus sp. PR]|uniref:methyltetrahydrofolate cobalamin methyltransferase n=1 Tax=Candidatus Desulfosporosinus nitrosoreducens TaxID=3401928 RepID=UPI0027EE3BC4|nr:methyltetrahydrofolate cobalamin methyltransferase [Desulfosporosinus sp. PR]MDQ7093575.1 methyltetrahydrofolate cobalamin methyltransferase [Desulfosporosinus sp. PR]